MLIDLLMFYALRTDFVYEGAHIVEGREDVLCAHRADRHNEGKAQIQISTTIPNDKSTGGEVINYTVLDM